MCELKYIIKRVPFTCPYNDEEWKVIIIQNVINEINNYKSMFKL